MFNLYNNTYSRVHEFAKSVHACTESQYGDVYTCKHVYDQGRTFMNVLL